MYQSKFSKNEEESSGSEVEVSYETDSESEIVEETPSAPSVPDPVVSINKFSLIGKLSKIEELLIKFNQIYDISPLVKSLSDTTHFLQALNVKDLDELKKLGLLEKLNRIDVIVESLKNLQHLNKLQSLDKLESLNKLSKLDTFNDDRINNLFIGIEQINGKNSDIKKYLSEDVFDKLSTLKSNIEILTLSF